MFRIAIFGIAALIALPAFAEPFHEMWAADTCHSVHEAMSFDPDEIDKNTAEYAAGMSMMTAAYGFLHGYAVANGWHEVEGFDYVEDFRETCGTYPARPPMMILTHLF